MRTIRIRPTVSPIAPGRMAALVTHAVVSPTLDDGAASGRVGTNWVRWADGRSSNPTAN